MKKFFGLFLVLVFSFVTFANPFSDVPFSHWAYDAVAKLSAKGIITGFPDGTFKGQRQVTRYELAMILARLMAKMDGGISMPNMSAADKKTVEKLTVELADELSLLGVKVTALEDEVAVLKDDVAMMKEGGAVIGSGDSKVKFGGSMNMYYYNVEDDTKTQTNNWYNEIYTELTFKPTKDVKVFVQNFSAFDWNGLTGGDYTIPGDDRIKRVYLEMSDFDLFGLTTFEKATFGRNDFKLGNGLLIDARMTGIRFDAEDYTFFTFTDNGDTSSFSNIWGIDYKIQKGMKLYYMEARQDGTGADIIDNFTGVAGPDGLADDSIFNLPLNDKVNAFGITYAQDMFDFEYVSASLDKGFFVGTEDTANGYSVNVKATDDMTFKYTVRENGLDQINNFAAPANSILEESLSRFGGTKAMMLKYAINPNFCVVYENVSEEDVAVTGAIDVTAISLGYNKEIKPGVDMKLSYSMVSDDDTVSPTSNGTVVGVIDPAATSTLNKTSDVNVLRLEMSVKF
ncbi:MAG: S-layer homology domain-containing protein [Candidatus Muirbacterium halophilum]|nr:S-layer homology domain-containing protein [Candidatus Muirbacterium halophilum]MCK9475804.1 S-layer homology domain-containing protein [Candidatus Muirbacterium halophilum]